jgi:hypothetical protein
MDYLVDAVAKALPTLTTEQVTAVVAGAKGLWDALEEVGLVDGYGGAESERVLPVVAKVLLAESNPLREDFQ